MVDASIQFENGYHFFKLIEFINSFAGGGKNSIKANFIFKKESKYPLKIEINEHYNYFKIVVNLFPDIIEEDFSLFIDLGDLKNALDCYAKNISTKIDFSKYPQSTIITKTNNKLNTTNTKELSPISEVVGEEFLIENEYPLSFLLTSDYLIDLKRESEPHGSFNILCRANENGVIFSLDDRNLGDMEFLIPNKRLVKYNIHKPQKISINRKLFDYLCSYKKLSAVIEPTDLIKFQIKEDEYMNINFPLTKFDDQSNIQIYFKGIIEVVEEEEDDEF